MQAHDDDDQASPSNVHGTNNAHNDVSNDFSTTNKVSTTNGGEGQEAARNALMPAVMQLAASTTSSTAMVHHLSALHACGYTQKHVVDMLSCTGGPSNLVLVQDHHAALESVGLTPDQVVQMVAKPGGSSNLVAVHEACAALRALDFSADQVMMLLAQQGGSTNLAAVQQNVSSLQALGCTADEVLMMVALRRGGRNLVAVQSNIDALQTLHFSSENLLVLLEHGDIDGAATLDAVSTNLVALQAVGLTADQVVAILKMKGGTKNLQALTQNLTAVLDSRLRADQVCEILSTAAYEGFAACLYLASVANRSPLALITTPFHMTGGSSAAAQQALDDGGARAIVALKQALSGGRLPPAIHTVTGMPHAHAHAHAHSHPHPHGGALQGVLAHSARVAMTPEQWRQSYHQDYVPLGAGSQPIYNIQSTATTDPMPAAAVDSPTASHHMVHSTAGNYSLTLCGLAQHTLKLREHTALQVRCATISAVTGFVLADYHGACIECFRVTANAKQASTSLALFLCVSLYAQGAGGSASRDGCAATHHRAWFLDGVFSLEHA